jgi:glutathione synthase/RimK-type ligase-like ATP-grasp enzyme
VTDAGSRRRPGERRATHAYVQQAPDHGHTATILDVAEADRLGGFDAAFLRLDTNVLGLSFAASRLAWELGLRVVDDPKSIVTCMNKAHVQGLLEAAAVPTPETVLLTRAGRASLDAAALFDELGSPIICKAPSGSFSSAVEKADTPRELERLVARFAKRSDVVLLQRYEPSAFDWRIGFLAGRPLYTAKYHIPSGAWRIHDRPEGETRRRWARIERVPLDETPRPLLDIAARACGTIGTGLYGVDVKERDDGSFVVIEVNDNPSIDHDGELAADSDVYGLIIHEIATQGPRR